MAGKVTLVLLLGTCSALVWSMPNKIVVNDDRNMHKHPPMKMDHSKMREGEDTAEFWNDQARATITDKLVKTEHNKNVAKNVILFIGDGMSIPTLMAARVWMAQKEGKDNGEENSLSFEEFPYAGLSKTYCVDAQVADSACSATAYLCGVKGNDNTIGVTAAVLAENCTSSLDPKTHVDSIARWSQLKGKKTGLVTTTRVTHASPSGVYAHVASRDWENDVDSEPGCDDIAKQLIYGETGTNLNVIMGGGRKHFLRTSDRDPEGLLTFGERKDENLIEKWQELKQGKAAHYVWNRDDLLAIPDDSEFVLGLFESDHTQYELDRDEATEPSLTEMVEKSIKLLQNSEQGYFLFVEGGRIDHAHHASMAKRALDETLSLSNAVQKAVEMTSSEDTLIVVTSDHAHTMSVAGYPVRGNDIFGQPEALALDLISYSTITYANGPGYRRDQDGVRYDISKDDTHNSLFMYPSVARLLTETHGGDDVGIFAQGPWAHLLSGSIEQNVIPHVMAYASCVGNGATACD